MKSETKARRKPDVAGVSKVPVRQISRTQPEGRARVVAAKFISSGTRVFRPERNWVKTVVSTLPPKPAYLQELEQLLVQDVAQAPAPQADKQEPIRVFTDSRSIFAPINSLQAFQPGDDDGPQDQAAQLIAGEFAPAYYDAHVPGGPPRPNRCVRPFCHNPLYFEDINLERCGRTNGYWAQPVCSFAKFFGSTLITPYLLTLDPPDTCVKAGPDCPTCHEFSPEQTALRWDWKAAAVQTGVVTGLFYFIP